MNSIEKYIDNNYIVEYFCHFDKILEWLYQTVTYSCVWTILVPPLTTDIVSLSKLLLLEAHSSNNIARTLPDSKVLGVKWGESQCALPLHEKPNVFGFCIECMVTKVHYSYG